MPKSASTVGGAVGAVGDPLDTGWMVVNGGLTGPTYYQTGAATYSFANTSTYTVNTPSNEFQTDVYIERNGKRIAVGKTLEQIMERLCIIEPAFELIEKYPALKEAYDNYKMIEALVKNGTPDDEQLWQRRTHNGI